MNSTARSSNKQLHTMSAKVVAVVLAVLLWQLLSMLLSQEVLLASPLRVCQALLTIYKEPLFFSTIWKSCCHILLGFLAGLFCGLFLAILSAKVPFMEQLLWPYLSICKATPIASFIILFLVWFKVSQLSIFISFLVVFPIVYTNLLQGLKHLDFSMQEFASIYQLSAGRRLIGIYLPQLKDYVLAAIQLSIGMSWKAGIAAEVIGVPANSIGHKLYDAKIYLTTPELLAWTVVIILLSILLEKLIVALFKFLYHSLENFLWIIN